MMQQLRRFLRRIPEQQNRLSRLLFGLVLMIAGLGLAGCGAASNGDTEVEINEEGDGELIIGLTDAEGDFASYTVDVVSLTLTKANGTVVQTLPLSTRVDFAQYTEMTEFLTAATVPAGVYTRASMVLDYSNADIWVENASGDAVQVSNIIDSAGNPITELEMVVQLEGRHSLRIVPGVPAHLTLDFDLEATNSVEFDDAGVPTQTVEPLLLAELDVEHFKTHRLRGPLAEVAVDDSRFKVILRPFHHVLNDHRQRRFGAMDVRVNDATLYEIDGETYEGQAGLVALDALPAISAVVVLGDIKLNPRRFEAREVYAGSSVPGGSQDVITGNVIARNSDTFTVKGATLIRAGGSVVFNDEVTIQLGDMTTVKRQRSMGNTWTIDDISIGQRVRVFGTLTSDTADQLQMDAGVNNAGRVQMRFTTLRGTVLGMAVIQIVPTPVVPFVIDLQAIDGRRVSLFDFSGTGIDAANDANPAGYEIDTGNLDVSALMDDGTPVKVRGFVRPFGQAPANFEAHTVMDAAHIKAVMTVNWDPASNTAIDRVTADGMTLNFDGVGRFHHLVRSRVAINLTGLDTALRIMPRTDGESMYWIVRQGTHQLHTRFADFADDLGKRLVTDARVKHVAASGRYADDSGVLTAGLIRVVLE
jgi:hypothetical protein